MMDAFLAVMLHITLLRHQHEGGTEVVDIAKHIFCKRVLLPQHEVFEL